MSPPRFSIRVDTEGSPVWYSTNGSSATWESRTAVPNAPRSGGTTLSLMRRCAAAGDDLGERRLVDVVAADDHAVGQFAAARRAHRVRELRVAAARSESLELDAAGHAQVDVREQLELAPRGALERPGAEQQHAGRAGPPSPQRRG